MHAGSEKRAAVLAAKASAVMLGDVMVTRHCGDGSDPAGALDLRRENAFDVIVELAPSSHLRLWKGESLVADALSPKGALTILDLREQWRCERLSEFDSLRFRVSLDGLRKFVEAAGRPQSIGLACAENTVDNVVLGIAQALLPFLDEPSQTSPLFLEQIGLALLTHLTQTYGGVYFPSRRKGTLATWQEKRATDFLAAHINVAFSIGDLAATCNLSRSYFIKAFKETFGTTPYRWLIDYRLVKAKEMLQTDTSIAEIAATCGFADQSHFTRTFSDIIGLSPGNWRRQHCPPLSDR